MQPFRWLEALLEQVPEHARRINRLEEQMADITQAQADLAAQVDATLAEIATLEEHVATLQAAVDSGSPAEIQAAADAIEAQVTRLKGALPASPTATPPADAAPSA
jgi:predicted  nucleic acid-binding Zn-ribbon protein